jgi:twinkle protein
LTDSKLVSAHQPCPDDTCGSSDAYSLYSDGHGFCFSCNTYFPSKDKPYVYQSYTYEYLPTRGLYKNTLEFYDIKTRIDTKGEPLSLVFPYPNKSNKVRDLAVKDFRTEKGPQGESINDAGLFGQDKFSAGGGRSITITEGELDAASLWQVLGSNPAYAVCSVQSSSTAHRDCSHARSWINSFEKIYLCFDGDDAGRRACAQVAKLFDPAKVYHVKLTKRKDANEYLQAGEGEELKKIWWNSRIYRPENVISSLQDFYDILEKDPEWGVPLPWKKLTEMTYGLRKGESVLVTAQEKVGKTEVFHFIEHKLLTETKSNVACFFLEEQPRRHLEALAAIQIQKPCHLPDSGVSKADRQSAIAHVVGVDDRLFIVDQFGSYDPDALLDLIRYFVVAHSVEYVLFDNITVSVTGLGEEKERIILDYLSTKLEMLAKELNFCLLYISHLNDYGQTRGSRNLGKVCDTRIDITRNLQAHDEIEKQTWNFNLAYARFGGKSGPAGRVIFHPETYSFTELDDHNPTADNDNGHGALRSKAA